MTTFYNWIQSKKWEDTTISNIARMMQESTWKNTSEYKGLCKKFKKAGLLVPFEEVYKQYLKELSAPCRHDKNNECFYMKDKIGKNKLMGAYRSKRNEQ